MSYNKMPMLFVGHGSPMNAIEDNEFTRKWEEVGKKLKTPKAILAISAHWYTDGTRIQEEESPKMIYDMYGFPKEMYEIVYPAKGNPKLAREAMELIGSKVTVDHTWGLDHGIWSVLVKMYPNAEIPVVQLSVDGNADSAEHYKMGTQLSKLREEGVLILASGNVVHNLREVDWENSEGTAWALDFDSYIKEAVLSGNYESAVNYHAHKSAVRAVPTPDHFYPLLYILGAADKKDTITVFNDSCIMGSLSMTSYLFE